MIYLKKQAPMSTFSMTSSDKSIVSIFILKIILVGRDLFTPKTSITLNTIKAANLRRKINLNKSIGNLKYLNFNNI